MREYQPPIRTSRLICWSGGFLRVGWPKGSMPVSSAATAGAATDVSRWNGSVGIFALGQPVEAAGNSFEAGAIPPRISLYEIRVARRLLCGYAALFAAPTLAPTTRDLNSSTVITSAVENASIVNVARWTSAADSAP